MFKLIRVYPRPPAEYKFPSPTLFQCLKVIDIGVWNQLDIPWASIENRYIVTLNDLGPYCASLFLYQEIHYHVSRIIIENKRSIIEKLDDIMEMEGILPVSIPSFSTLPDDFPVVVDILYEFEVIFPTGATYQPLSMPVTLDWCTPKVKLLIDILVHYCVHVPNFQCIIFVEQRQVASCLSGILPSIPELQGKIKCAFLTGQGTNSDGVSKQTDRTYGDPVKLFRDREINIRKPVIHYIRSIITLFSHSCCNVRC